MRCAEVRRLFSRRMDRELPPPEQAAVEAHLSLCPECAGQWRRFSIVVEGVRALPRVALSDTGRARVRRAIQGAQARPERVPLRAWAGMAAAAVLVLVSAVSLGLVLPQGPGGEGEQVVHGLANPSPELRLRDTRTGGWVEAGELVQGIKRAQRPVVIVPRIRVPESEIRSTLASQQSRMHELLQAHGVGLEQVTFLTPVTVDGNPLSGPPVELWVEEVRTASWTR